MGLRSHLQTCATPQHQVSQDGGVTFSMLSLTMPLGVGLMKWPPYLLCASRAINGRLGLWCLRLNLGDAVTAELEPLDEFSQSFDSYLAWEVDGRVV